MQSNGYLPFVFCVLIVLFNIPKNKAHGDIGGDIMDGAKDVHEKITDIYGKVIDNVKDTHDEMVDKAKDMADNAKDHTEGMREILLDPYGEVMEMFRLEKLEDFTEDVLDKVIKKFFAKFHCVNSLKDHPGGCRNSLVSIVT